MDWRLLALLCSVFLQYSIFAMPSPFFPVQAKNQGIPVYAIGIVLGSLALSSSIAAPLVGKYLETIGRRLAFVLSLVISGIGIAIWGVLPYLDLATFLIISLFGRLLQGIGFTLANVTALSMCASDYPQKVGSVFALMETTAGLGMIAGPMIGAVIYEIAGFTITFISYASIFFAVVPLFWGMLGRDRPYNKKEQGYKISVGTISFKGLIFVQFAMCAIVWFGFVAFDAVLAIYLDTAFGLDSSMIGLIFGVSLIAYIAGSLATGALLHRFRLYKVISSGAAIIGVSSLLLGPCTACGIPQELWIVIVGLFGFGLGAAIAYIPLLPFMIELACNRYGYQNDDILSDTLSAAMTSCVSMVTFACPILSSIAVQFWSFENMYSVLGFLTTTFTIFYAILFALERPPRRKSSLESPLLDIQEDDASKS